MTRLLPPHLVAIAAAATLAWACAVPAAPGAGTSRDHPAAFLVGTWLEEGGRAVEIWSEPHEGVMYGQSRSAADLDLRAFELLEIVRDGEELVYVARPGGRSATRFACTAHTARSITFENPAHDFPKRIHYELAADGAGLFATIDGGDAAGPRVEFRWRRAR